MDTTTLLIIIILVILVIWRRLLRSGALVVATHRSRAHRWRSLHGS
jgi:hypothetical protein